MSLHTLEITITLTDDEQIAAITIGETTTDVRSTSNGPPGGVYMPRRLRRILEAAAVAAGED